MLKKEFVKIFSKPLLNSEESLQSLSLQTRDGTKKGSSLSGSTLLCILDLVINSIGNNMREKKLWSASTRNVDN